MDTVDERLGDGLERVLCAHHARRLRRLGRSGVLTPRPDTDGYAAGPAVRDGNRIEVLIDGMRVLPAIAEAIRNARSSVHVAGWHITPDFRVLRDGDGDGSGDGGVTVRELLAEAAERVPVRVLLWAGPPLPVFEPTRARAKAARDALTGGTAVRCVLDARERTLHCHHEKLVIVDDAVAFVGGIDLTDVEGDRHDSERHPPHPGLGWHDAAMRIHGPLVADVAEHFRQRWVELTGDGLPRPVVPPPAGTSRAQLVRTVPERTYSFARAGEFSILDAYLRALHSARDLIYLENQFLWSPEVVEVLVDKLRHPPHDGFRVVLLLPRRPSNGADTTRGQLGRLLDADEEAGPDPQLLATTINSHDGERSGSVYVHAKVGIVDDRWLTIGSANLNEHSLFNDTEVNVVTTDAELARSTRLRLWSEHLQLPIADIDGDPAEVVDRCWRPVADEQARRESAGHRRTHRLSMLPGVSRRSERLAGPLRGLLVDG
ncbi:MAG TPA: phospholipase D family protein [Pseudonocardiaceae bacterium]